MRIVPNSVTVTNHTSYPTAEVGHIIRQELKGAEVDGVAVTVRYAKQGRFGGWWRSYWYPDTEDRPQILVRLPEPGFKIDDYVPYQRKREQGKRFSLEDWQEALVAIIAHEAEHHRQYQLGERSGRRGSGRRRSQVELRCDLAAYRAWKRWREERGLEVAV